jgi:hypothetical protein
MISDLCVERQWSLAHPSSVPSQERRSGWTEATSSRLGCSDARSRMWRAIAWTSGQLG